MTDASELWREHLLLTPSKDSEINTGQRDHCPPGGACMEGRACL